MTRYILNERYRFRGWYKLPTGIFDTYRKEAFFLDKDRYLLLLKCDGSQEFDIDALHEKEKDTLNQFETRDVIRKALPGEFLQKDQMYVSYPARYRKSVHWSITGACNLKCRHCFMSAPHAKHGVPSHEEIIKMIDQFVECGIFQVGITGGEPLTRGDLLEIIDLLNEREIGIDAIFTNGWLVDEAFLDELDKRKVYPGFQLSFDGVGCHDWLRGMQGAEEKTIQALKLLQERKYPVSISMCVHKKNYHTIRESVNLMASLGVKSMKCGIMMDLGEWMNPDLFDAKLSSEEEVAIFEEYIPQYFEDDAPLAIMMGGVFMYRPGDPTWHIYHEREITEDEAKHCPSCGVITKNFYIGADGVVAPCMGMADCHFASHFPNLKEIPLKDILRESEFVDLCSATIADIRDHNPKCKECHFVDRCTGGCRNAALMKGDDYYGIDPDVCEFFENGWDKRIKEIAQPAFEAYIKRNPPKENPNREEFYIM